MVATSAAKRLAYVLMLALTLASAAEPAHKRPRSVETSATMRQSPRLINLDEGMAIIGAALEIRYRRHPREDCSHLVHAIYEEAGFPFSYVDSSDLYAGVDSFRRVNHPQPGDLVVWKGHAAIVVNPAQHTFFSSTRTGLRVESYDLKYWKRRGTPRFFRYATMAAPALPSIIPTAASDGSASQNSQPASDVSTLPSPDQDSDSDPK